MKVLLYSAIVFLSAGALLQKARGQAVEPVVIRGNRYEIEGDAIARNMLKADSGSFYLVRTRGRRGREVVLSGYRASDLKLVQQNTITVPTINGQDADYAGALSFGGQLLLFFRHYDTKKNSHRSYGQLYDRKLQKTGEPVLLTQYGNDRKNRSDRVGIGLSNDKKTVMAYSVESAEEGGAATMTIWAYDLQLNNVWKNTFDLPISASAFRVREFLPVNRYNIRLLVSKRIQGMGELNVKGGYASKYILLEYDGREQSIKEVELNLGQKWIYSVDMQVSDSTKLAIAGFYSDLTELFVSGTFSLNFDLWSGEIKEQGLKSFDRDFEDKFRKGQENRGRIMNEFKTGKVQFLDNGDSYLSAERLYTKSISTYNPTTGFQNIYYEYRHEEMLLAQAKPNGSMRWAVKVPKYQAVRDRNCSFCGYAPIWKDSLRMVVYNDHYKNDDVAWDNPEKMRTLEEMDQAVAVAAVVWGNGKVEKYQVYDGGEDGLALKPQKHLKLRSGAEVFLCRGHKSFLFVKLDWKQPVSAE